MNNVDLINKWRDTYPGTLLSSESQLEHLNLIMTVDKSVTHDQKRNSGSRAVTMKPLLIRTNLKLIGNMTKHPYVYLEMVPSALWKCW